MMDLRRRQWNDDLLAALGVPRRMLPEIAPSSDPEAWGATLPDGPFGARVPIGGVIGDQQAALLGQLCRRPGEAKCTYGTGAFLLMHTGEEPVPSEAGLLTTVAYTDRDRAHYASRGRSPSPGRSSSGSATSWALPIPPRASSGWPSKSKTAPARSSSRRSPASSPPTGASDARGVICGLTRHTDRRHLARAAIEAAAFQVAEVLRAMREDSGFPVSELRVDGGMAVSDLLLGFQADLLGVPVLRPRQTETTALGAAICAGLAAGFWDSAAELGEALEVEARLRTADSGSPARRPLAVVEQGRPTEPRLGGDGLIPIVPGRNDLAAPRGRRRPRQRFRSEFRPGESDQA